MTKPQAVLAALLVAAAVPARGADIALPEEIRRYYEAWERLATASTAEDRRAAMAGGAREHRIREIKEAMDLIDSLELPLRMPMPNPGATSRWLLPIPRYVVSAPGFTRDGNSLMLRCTACLTDSSELYHLVDGPGGFALVAEPRGGVPLGIELHRWVRTDSGWRKLPLKQILIGCAPQGIPRGAAAWALDHCG